MPIRPNYKEYEPKFVDLQLQRIDTLDLKKEEKETLQAEIEKLKGQFSEALGVKHKQLLARMDELIAPERAEVEKTIRNLCPEIK